MVAIATKPRMICLVIHQTLAIPINLKRLESSSRHVLQLHLDLYLPGHHSDGQSALIRASCYLGEETLGLVGLSASD